MTLAVEHRRRQLVVKNAVIARLLSLWRIVDPADLSTVDRFTEAAIPVVEAGFGRSSQAAATYYKWVRPGAVISIEVPLPALPAVEEVAGLIRGASLAGIINGRRRGMTPERAARNGFVKASGSATNLVLRGGRDTLLEATQKDPASTGRWARVSGGNSCDFCLMLADRGFVYSEESSDFEAHDHCACTVEPEFG